MAIRTFTTELNSMLKSSYQVGSQLLSISAQYPWDLWSPCKLAFGRLFSLSSSWIFDVDDLCSSSGLSSEILCVLSGAVTASTDVGSAL